MYQHFSAFFICWIINTAAANFVRIFFYCYQLVFNIFFSCSSQAWWTFPISIQQIYWHVYMWGSLCLEFDPVEAPRQLPLDFFGFEWLGLSFPSSQVPSSFLLSFRFLFGNEELFGLYCSVISSFFSFAVRPSISSSVAFS